MTSCLGLAGRRSISALSRVIHEVATTWAAPRVRRPPAVSTTEERLRAAMRQADVASEERRRLTDALLARESASGAREELSAVLLRVGLSQSGRSGSPTS